MERNTKLEIVKAIACSSLLVAATAYFKNSNDDDPATEKREPLEDIQELQTLIKDVQSNIKSIEFDLFVDREIPEETQDAIKLSFNKLRLLEDGFNNSTTIEKKFSSLSFITDQISLIKEELTRLEKTLPLKPNVAYLRNMKENYKAGHAAYMNKFITLSSEFGEYSISFDGMNNNNTIGTDTSIKATGFDKNNIQWRCPSPSAFYDIHSVNLDSDKDDIHVTILKGVCELL